MLKISGIKNGDIIRLYDSSSEGIIVDILSRNKALELIVDGDTGIYIEYNKNIELKPTDIELRETKNRLNAECDIKTYDTTTGKEIACSSCERHKNNGRKKCLYCGKRFKKLL